MVLLLDNLMELMLGFLTVNMKVRPMVLMTDVVKVHLMGMYSVK